MYIHNNQKYVKGLNQFSLDRNTMEQDFMLSVPRVARVTFEHLECEKLEVEPERPTKFNKIQCLIVTDHPQLAALSGRGRV